MYCPLGAFIRGLCTGVKSSQWLFFIAEETISIAGYLKIKFMNNAMFTQVHQIGMFISQIDL